HQIEQDRVGARVVDALERRLAIDREVHHVALVRQHLTEGLADHRLVIDDEDAPLLHRTVLRLRLPIIVPGRHRTTAREARCTIPWHVDGAATGTGLRGAATEDARADARSPVHPGRLARPAGRANRPGAGRRGARAPRQLHHHRRSPAPPRVPADVPGHADRRGAVAGGRARDAGRDRRRGGAGGAGRGRRVGGGPGADAAPDAGDREHGARAQRPDRRGAREPAPELAGSDEPEQGAVVTAPALRIAGDTHVGKVRTTNEDSLIVEPRHGLYAVLDGMGGASAGDVASQLARDTIRDFVLHRWMTLAPRALLEAAIVAGSTAVFLSAQH